MNETQHLCCRQCHPDCFPPASLSPTRVDSRHVAARFGLEDCLHGVDLNGERLDPARFILEAYDGADGWVITEIQIDARSIHCPTCRATWAWGWPDHYAEQLHFGNVRAYKLTREEWAA